MSRIRPSRTAWLALLALSMAATPAVAQGPNPLQIAAQFLSLSEKQVTQIVAIRQATEEAAGPIAQEIAQRAARLGELVAGEAPNPAEVGAVFLSIRALEQQLGTLRQDGAEQMQAVLDSEQLEQLATAAGARPVCQVIPALTKIGLM